MRRILSVLLLFTLFMSSTWALAQTPPTTDTKKQEQDFEAKLMKDKEEKLKKLSKIQAYVTQEGGTEKPFQNEYWNNHEDGIYVDVVSGEPLFSSLDKFDSGTGWPSFTKPIAKSALSARPDPKSWLPATEIRSTKADSHLGHVFDDGPKDKGGARYCINSSALRFIPKAELEKQGYGEYLYLFEPAKKP